MRRRVIGAIVAAAAGLVSIQASAAESVEPRPNVIAVADRIEERFYDPVRAREIAAGLREQAASGRYDALTDPHDLANALTDKLQSGDRHFQVEWVGNAPAEAAAQPQRPRTDAVMKEIQEIQARRSNYGFRRIEVLPGNLGYIDLREFAKIDFSDRDSPAWRAADAALALVSRADAMIFDLRDNGGGAPSMVGYLASAFVPAHADVYNVFHSREGMRSEAPDVKYASPMTQKPVYILTSSQTASAAEAFAYTLQAARRAVIVGEPSYGAANPGNPVPTGTGFTIFIATASPRNPLTGDNWETTGVIPDVSVPPADALLEAQKRALRATVRSLPATERTYAEWALAALEADPAPQPDLPALAGSYGAVTVAVQEDGTLHAHGGGRSVRLRPLARDLFYAEGDPSFRAAFERDASGRPVVLEVRVPDGNVMRFRRG